MIPLAPGMPALIVTVTPNPAVDETLTVPTLQLGETNRIKDTEVDPGGKGLNVARVIKRLGRATVAIAFTGGETGHFIRDRLRREGVESDFVEIMRSTRVNISILDESSGVQTNLNHEGPHIEAANLRALERTIDDRLSEGMLLVMGGSLPPGAPADTYSRLIRRAREAGKRSILDASGFALSLGIKAQPYLIKPNRREMESLVGRKLDSDDGVISAGREVLALGVEVVVVSLGPQGAIAVSGDRAIKAVPPEVEVQSTIGAGDSMVAGLAIGVAEDATLESSLALGTAASAATVMAQGTELCRPEDVRELLPKVTVERIA